MVAENLLPQWDAGWVAAACNGTWDISPGMLAGVGTDTRSLPSGCLFIALKGDRFDGHDYVEKAIANGAAGCMVEMSWRGESALPLLRVDDTRLALGRLASAHRRRVDPVTIGITGSVGKSTVKQMLMQLLSGIGSTAGTHGNWNNDIGLPLSLLAMPFSTDFGVFEVGTNHPGEVAPLCDIMQPVVGMVTNVGPVHIENFNSEASIAAEKAMLISSLPPDGVVIVDADGAYYRNFVEAASSRRVVTVAEKRDDVDFRLLEVDAVSGSFSLYVRESGETIRLEVGHPGRYQIDNAMFAVAAASLCGCRWDAIAERLPRFSPMPMRWQVESVDGVTVVNDAYNANTLSMRAAIKTFADMSCKGRRWLVLGDMLELGDFSTPAHRELGRFVAAGNWAGVVGVGELMTEMLEGAAEAGMAPELLLHAEDAAAAAKILKMRADVADAVLLKGSRGIALERVLQALKGEL